MRLNDVPLTARWLPLAALAVVGAVAYAPYLDLYFVGSDAITSIDTSRIASPRDFLATWGRPFMAGSSFPLTDALIYRPLVALTFAVDYAIWQLEPRGYLFTNLVLHLLAGTFLYAFLRTLRVSWWAALLGALILVLHPGMMSAVPVAARRHDSFAAASLFASMALLCLSLQASGRKAKVARTGSIIAFAIALLGKESAFGAVPLVPFVFAVARFAFGDPGARNLRSYVPAVAPYLGVAIGVFVVRYLVVGAVGGYVENSIALATPAEYRTLINRYVFFIFWPFRMLAPASGWGWLALSAITSAILAGALAAMSGRHRTVALLGIVWIVGFGAFFIGLKTLAGAWYLYYPMAGVGLFVGATLDGAVSRARTFSWSPGARNRQIARAAPLAILVLASGVYAGGVLRESALFTHYEDWEISSETVESYLADVVECTRTVDPGAVLLFEEVPQHMDLGTPESAMLTMSMVQKFTLESALRLAHGHTYDIRISSYRTLYNDLEPPVVSCSQRREGLVITARWLDE